MDKKQITVALEKVKKDAPKRNFDQSIDLIINLKDLDFKKPDHQVDIFVTLHHTRGKPVRVGAFVGPELADQAKEECNSFVKSSDFKAYDPKKVKVLAKNNDIFIAQANVMKEVAGSFGRVLGPRNKMPNPKAGAVVPPGANLKQLVERLQKVVRVSAKKSPVVHVMVGKQKQSTEEVVDNILTIYNQVAHALPQEQNNIKESFLKLTMSKPVKI
jgi:large subunit ribosomal protein L1